MALFVRTVRLDLSSTWVINRAQIHITAQRSIHPGLDLAGEGFGVKGQGNVKAIY